MKRGFIVGTNEIAKIPINVLENRPIDFEYNVDEVKTALYAGG